MRSRVHVCSGLGVVTRTTDRSPHARELRRMNRTPVVRGLIHENVVNGVRSSPLMLRQDIHSCISSIYLKESGSVQMSAVTMPCSDGWQWVAVSTGISNSGST
uniref:(northern house mosquito) hypothetical protein n=1 Tax=Culex pipiens TaxID=7175 RepID=A0A8D8MPV2_CULPI